MGNRAGVTLGGPSQAVGNGKAECVEQAGQPVVERAAGGRYGGIVEAGEAGARLVHREAAARSIMDHSKAGTAASYRERRSWYPRGNGTPGG